LLLEQVDLFRLDAGRKLDPAQRVELGQFLTPPPAARLMASMFGTAQPHIRLLDPGAGVGSLTAAFVSELCHRKLRPKSISVTAYEIAPAFLDYLRSTLNGCHELCQSSGVNFSFQIIEGDFIDGAVEMLRQELYQPVDRFHCAILNPPYRKINSDSETRFMLREVGIETSNLYTAFLALAMMLLGPSGELVAITPRSFCNGPYFKPFRKLLLDTLALKRIHVFDSRQVAFKEDEVLQENIIFHGVHAKDKAQKIVITSSESPEDEHVVFREVDQNQLVRPGDTEHFIHIVPDELGDRVVNRLSSLRCSLPDLNIEVSTGRVVDFRATKFLRESPGSNTVPLIFPMHFEKGYVKWPRKNGKKPNALAMLPGAEELVVPSGPYVLVRRFSAKEEDRRVVAAVYDPARIDSEHVGFENHLNYYHRRGKGLSMPLAKGLAAFLNSTLVDLYFRQFNGHTQVNATDLRSLRYPTERQLVSLGSKIKDQFPDQETLDHLIETEVLEVPHTGDPADPVKAKKKIEEALSILKEIGLPREQQNERSALTLLALLGLDPKDSWKDAKKPLMGITPMMDFFAKHYGRQYAPNTRETVRRQTVHQFLDAGIVVANPDKHTRPTNSPKAVYQIESGALTLLRTYGSPEWQKSLATYLASVQSLKAKYAREREMKRIPVRVAQGQEITLSPGGQNVLIEQILKHFCERFTPGGEVVYVGDTDEKWAYFNERLLKSLGVTIESHGKMPDVIIYLEAKNWLVLIEAVTSHGPVNPKRRNELKALFRAAKPGLVYVTSFLDRRSMVKYLPDISWETEVWVANAPGHLIHFNGERFLGPYEE
jgi:adenine-specific DNA-methyltransferase